MFLLHNVSDGSIYMAFDIFKINRKELQCIICTSIANSLVILQEQILREQDTADS